MIMQKYNQCNVIAFWLDGPNRVSFIGNRNGEGYSLTCKQIDQSHSDKRQTQRFQGRSYDANSYGMSSITFKLYQMFCIASLSSPFMTIVYFIST